MTEIFVNLKRFDVPKKLGGICSHENPQKWIEWVLQETANFGLGAIDGIHITYLLPESLLLAAIAKKKTFPSEKVANMDIGSQGVYRENIVQGVNFGAFTTHLPAAAVYNMGARWAIIGHSEERKDKLGIIAHYDSVVGGSAPDHKAAGKAVNAIINEEVLCAFNSGINVLLCVGETEEERGAGSFEEQKPRIKTALHNQLVDGLAGTKTYISTLKLVIGYEPIWAIGPGKTPPGEDYIAFVSSFIKETVQQTYGFVPQVVYGGGLKEENAAMISGIENIDGGLVALTRFSGDIGFEPKGLKNIIECYMEGEQQ